MTANIFTSIPNFDELLASIPNASEFFIDKEKISGELKEIYDSIEIEREFESLESIELRLRSICLSKDDLIKFTAKQIAWNELTDWHNDNLKKINYGLSKLLGFYSDIHEKSTNAHNCVIQLDEIINKMEATASFLEGQVKGRDAQKTIHARNAAKGKLEKDPKQKAIKEITAYYEANKHQFKRRGYSAQFTREMYDKFPEITAIKTIENLVAKLNKGNELIPR